MRFILLLFLFSIVSCTTPDVPQAPTEGVITKMRCFHEGKFIYKGYAIGPVLFDRKTKIYNFTDKDTGEKKVLRALCEMSPQD